MALDPEVPPILELFEALEMPEPGSVPASVMREAFVAPPVEEPTPVSSIEDTSLPGPDGPVPVRIYRPSLDSITPVVVYFHGGGWVMGSPEMSDEFARQLCSGSECTVVSVDYRLAPETPFPGGLEDCYAATAWTAENAEALGVDATRLAVAGDSAGGNLAAAVCLLARERGGPAIAHQLLIYPVTDDDFERPSYVDNAEGYLLTRDMMRWFWEQYLADPAEADNPLVAPLKADLSGTPGATVITAGYDPLRDEGNALAERLAAAGVPVELRQFPGMVHGFLTLAGGLTQTGVAMDYQCQRLRECLGV